MQDTDFLSVATDIRTGGIFAEFDDSRANTTPGAMPNRILYIGQMLAGGSATPGVPVQIFGGAGGDYVGWFVLGSHLERMVTAGQNANPWTEQWAIPLLDNGAGTPATGSVIVSGPATVAGTQTFYIAGDSTMFGFLVEVAVTVGMTAAQFATALVAAIAALEGCPVTAVVDGGNPAKVDFTAIHKGECGNTVDLRTVYYAQDANVPGLTFAFTPMSGGAGNPSLTAAIAAVSQRWFNHWIVPYSDGTSLAAMNIELTRRWGGMVMQEGHSYFTFDGTVGARASFGNTYNTQQPTCMGTHKSPSPGYLWSAVIGCVAAYNSAINPCRGLRTLLLPGIGAPAAADQDLWEDRNNLLFDGISTYYVDDNNQVRIERLITMYRLNAAGAADPGYLACETLFTLFKMRWDWRNYMASIYVLFIIADDGTPIRAGSRVTTPKRIWASTCALAQSQWLGVYIQNIADFIANGNAARSITEPDRVNVLLPPNLLSPLNTIAGQFQFILGTATPAALATSAGP